MSRINQPPQEDLSRLNKLLDQVADPSGPGGAKVTKQELEAVIKEANADGQLTDREKNLIAYKLKYAASGFEDAEAGGPEWEAEKKEIESLGLPAMPIDDAARQNIKRLLAMGPPRESAGPQGKGLDPMETGAAGPTDTIQVGPGERLPQEVVNFIVEKGWPQMHANWHQTWNAVDWSSPKNVRKLSEFLEMHGQLFQQLKEKFPDLVDKYFTGKPPPRWIFDGLGAGVVQPMNIKVGYLEAYDVMQDLTTKPAAEVKALLSNPTYLAQHPWLRDKNSFARAIEETVHNYAHNFLAESDPSKAPYKPLDMGEPLKNMFNTQFWQLHGWIENARAAYYAATGSKIETGGMDMGGMQM